MDRAALTISIAATFSGELLPPALSFWLNTLNLPSQIRLVPYGRMLHELADQPRHFSPSSSSLNVFLIRPADWSRDDGAQTTESDPAHCANVEKNLAEFCRLVQQVQAPTIVYNCPGAASDAAFSSGQSGATHIVFVPSTYWNPSDRWLDPQSDAIAHVPYIPEFFVRLASDIARRVHLVLSSPRKVIAVDCDNTLWKGECGEGSVRDLEVDERRRALQHFLVEKADSGFLLCLSSKNNESDVQQAFRLLAGMPLSSDRITAARVNWLPKSENLRSLADQLGLGLDSFIFIDDDPLECAQVRTDCPEILTLQFPDESSSVRSWLENIWPFDRGVVTAEDRRRAGSYREEAQRHELRSSARDVRRLMVELQLEIDFCSPHKGQYGRLAQLNQRVNQFNCCGVRRTESELSHVCESGKLECRIVQVSDRFGDYGTVGALLYKPAEQVLYVDTFLLSCRALGRGVEQEMLRHLAVQAVATDCTHIEIPFVRTARNEPARRFLEQLGTPEIVSGDGCRYRIPTRQALELEMRRSESPTDVPERQGTGPGAGQSVSERWELMQALLAEPGQVVQILDEQRKNLAGQVDRPAHNGNLEIPRDPTEEHVAAIWREVLSLESVGVFENFFAVGGDSLAAVRMVTRLQSSLGIDFPIRLLFEDPTIAGVAGAVARLHIASADPGEIERLLAAMRGFSDEQAVARLNAETPARSTQGLITTLGLVTSRRPGLLARALDSYIANAQAFGRGMEYLVVDDSPAGESANTARGVVEAISTAHLVDGHFIGAEEKRVFVKRLAEVGVAPPEVIEFALFDTEQCGHSSGANRNALALLTAGRCVFSADDDSICRPFMDSGTASQPRRFHNEDPARFSFFASHAEALRAVTPAVIDIIEAHSRYLRQSGQGDGVVALTFNGLVGDCAWGSPFGYWGTPLGFLLLNDESLDRFCNSEELYRATCTMREVVRVVPGAAVGDFSFCMTTFYGFDNRLLLPPFLPVRRGQDLVLGATLRAYAPEYRAAHLPFALEHAPQETRRFWPRELFRSASGYDLARVVIDCVLSAEVDRAKSIVDRLRVLGGHLVELGAMPLPDFADFMRRRSRATADHVADLAESRISKSKHGAFWEGDLRKYVASLRQASRRDDFWIPLDLAHREGRDTRELTQCLIYKFGCLLQHWPDMITASRSVDVGSLKRT